MLGLLEDLATPPRARVLGEDGCTVENAYGAIIDDERAHVTGMDARDRVAIGVDADEALRVDLHRLDATGLGQRVRQRQQARTLVGEHLAHGTLPDRRVRSNVGDLDDELGERAIAVVDGVDDAAGEKPIAEVADRALDLAFVLRLAHGAELGLDAHRGTQRE